MIIDVKRTVSLFGNINHEVSGRIIGEVAKIVSGDSPDEQKDILLFISSGGGYVDAGNLMIDTLPLLSQRIVTLGSGNVSSMAIPLLVLGYKRLVTKHTRFLFHDIGRTFGKDERLGLTGAESSLKDLRVLQDWYIEYVVSRSSGKIDSDKIREIMSDETFLYPEEMLRYGLIDEIIAS